MKKHSPKFLKLVNDAKATIQETNPGTVHDRLSAKERFHLLDVRELNEWQNGHLPGAIYLGKGIIERDIEQLVPELNAEIILYCGGGFRSALAAETLGRMGYTEVSSMDGGYREWTNANFPTITPTP